MCVYLSASLKSGSHSIPRFCAHFSQSTCYLPFIPLQNRKTATQFIVLYTSFHLIDSLFPVHGVSYLTRLHWLISLFQAP